MTTASTNVTVAPSKHTFRGATFADDPHSIITMSNLLDEIDARDLMKKNIKRNEHVNAWKLFEEFAAGGLLCRFRRPRDRPRGVLKAQLKLMMAWVHDRVQQKRG